MDNKKIRVAITHGDINGIGYEVILRAFEEPMMLDTCTPIIYGSSKLAAFHAKAMGIDTHCNLISEASEAKDNRVNLIDTFDEAPVTTFGEASEESYQAGKHAAARAKEDLKNGLVDVLVQGPMVPNNQFNPGDKTLTILLSERVRIALVVTNLPLAEVAQQVTIDKLVEKGVMFNKSLKRDFRINNPRIAVLAINAEPGDEEEHLLSPAISDMEKQGVQAFGPYAAETFFEEHQYESFDGVLAMCDEQAQQPFEVLSPEYSVKVKAGLPVVCTTPGHGPMFEIAGQGVASATSMRQAIYAAVDMYRHRKTYDEPFGNPLPKLYHEKREDGDKARFAMPRAKDVFK